MSTLGARQERGESVGPNSGLMGLEERERGMRAAVERLIRADCLTGDVAGLLASIVL